MNQYDRYVSREEIAKYNARCKAEHMRTEQRRNVQEKKSIITDLDKMDGDELRLIHTITHKIKKYKVFFETLKEL